MVFSSLVFMFVFLPCLLVCYYAVPERFMPARNSILLAFSLIFYFYGEPKMGFLLLALLGVNYVGGLLVCGKWRKVALWLAILLNLLALYIFKYLDFSIDIFNKISGKELPFFYIVMPLGISFFTFQALSYLIDVYRTPSIVQRNPWRLSLYLMLFPQLVAGPIVRYTEIASQLSKREHSLSLFSSGIERFVVGLSKKLLLADAFSLAADNIFSLGTSIENTALAWVGAFAYTLQIYYDFSGYSDMAIGLGRMFGFHLPENFNYPYISRSATEFWKRWNMTLGAWFRDYLYIPLGGNRKGLPRQLLNIVVVWTLTGLWHGAAWNFVMWGAMYALLMIAEKCLYGEWMKAHKWQSYLYSFVIIIAGRVIFRADSLEHIMAYLKAMFCFSDTYQLDTEFFLLQLRWEWVLGLLFVMPVARYIKSHKWFGYIRTPITIILLALCLFSLLQNDYQPFLYFRF